MAILTPNLLGFAFVKQNEKSPQGGEKFGFCVTGKTHNLQLALVTYVPGSEMRVGNGASSIAVRQVRACTHELQNCNMENCRTATTAYCKLELFNSSLSLFRKLTAHDHHEKRHRRVLDDRDPC
jgi:hypothetical protein